MGSFPDYVVYVDQGEDVCFKHAVLAAYEGRDIETQLTEDYFRLRICQRCLNERENDE